MPGCSGLVRGVAIPRYPDLGSLPAKRSLGAGCVDRPSDVVHIVTEGRQRSALQAAKLRPPVVPTSAPTSML